MARKKKNPSYTSHKGSKVGRRWVSEDEIEKAVKARILSEPAVIDKLMTDFLSVRDEQRAITEEQVSLKDLLKDERGKPEQKLIERSIKDLEARKRGRSKDADRLRKSINEYYSASLRDAEDRLSVIRMMPAAPTHKSQISSVERLVKSAKAGKRITRSSAPIRPLDDDVYRPPTKEGTTPWNLKEGAVVTTGRGSGKAFSDQRDEFRELRAALITLEDTVSKTVVRRGSRGGKRSVRRQTGGIPAGSGRASHMTAKAFPSKYKGWVLAMRQETLEASNKFRNHPTTQSYNALKKVWHAATKKLFAIPGMKVTAALFLQFSEIGALKLSDIKHINRLKIADVSYGEIAKTFGISEKSVALISSTTTPEDRIPDIRHVVQATGFDHGDAKTVRKIYMDGQFVTVQLDVIQGKIDRGEAVTKTDILRIEEKLDVIFGIAKVRESRLTPAMARADIRTARASIKEAKELGFIGDVSTQRIIRGDIRKLMRKYSGAAIAEWSKKDRTKILEDFRGLEAVLEVARKGPPIGSKPVKTASAAKRAKEKKAARALAAAKPKGNPSARKAVLLIKVPIPKAKRQSKADLSELRRTGTDVGVIKVPASAMYLVAADPKTKKPLSPMRRLEGPMPSKAAAAIGLMVSRKYVLVRKTPIEMSRKAFEDATRAQNPSESHRPSVWARVSHPTIAARLSKRSRGLSDAELKKEIKLYEKVEHDVRDLGGHRVPSSEQMYKQIFISEAKRRGIASAKKNPIVTERYRRLQEEDVRRRRAGKPKMKEMETAHQHLASTRSVSAQLRGDRPALGKIADPAGEIAERAAKRKARGGKRRVMKPGGGQMKVINAKKNPGRRDARDFILSAAGDASQGLGLTKAEIRSVWAGKMKDFDETYSAMRSRGHIATKAGVVTLTPAGQRPFMSAHKRWEDQAIIQANPKKNASSITDRARVSILEFLENGETKDAAWDDWMTFGGRSARGLHPGGDDAAWDKAWGLAVRSGEIKKSGAGKYKTTAKGIEKRYALMAGHVDEVDPPMRPARRNPKKGKSNPGSDPLSRIRESLMGLKFDETFKRAGFPSSGKITDVQYLDTAPYGPAVRPRHLRIMVDMKVPKYEEYDIAKSAIEDCIEKVIGTRPKHVMDDGRRVHWDIPRSALTKSNPKKKPAKRKVAKKKVARKKTPPYQLLINRCHKLWTEYCERPSKKRLEAIYIHLDKMKLSTSQKAKAERSRCLRAANAEAKRLKYKRK